MTAVELVECAMAAVASGGLLVRCFAVFANSEKKGGWQNNRDKF
jgi:hypothetical protein